MTLHKHPQLKFGLVLAIGALVALVLCVQCVRTYLYTDAVLVPQQAEREASRQAGSVGAAARSAGIADPRRFGPVLEHVMASASDRILWMRVLDPHKNVVASAGRPEGTAKFRSPGWDRVPEHERPGTVIDASQGKALVVMLPLRIPPPTRPWNSQPRPEDLRAGRSDGRRAPYLLEIAISLGAVADAFQGLRQNLIVGLLASLSLLLSLVVIAVRSPHYLRGRYLETELQLARRVQNDLRPTPQSLAPHLDFAASAISADHVGGDFYDIFEAESGAIVIVLGDASGKGISAALLVSVLHGAIRSSTTSQHEYACARINHMLCERTASERFATLFWGVFDPATGTLRYVNAGHLAPMLVRHASVSGEIIRLDEGGPVLGLLANASYSAGTIKIESDDTLILYSDGISEATDRHEEEFGEQRIQHTVLNTADVSPAALCDRLLHQVTAFASADVPPDDRTFMVVKFLAGIATARALQAAELCAAVA